MSIRVCDNCGIAEANYIVYDIENQKTLCFCSMECYEEYRDNAEWLKQKSIEEYERMSKETIKDELLRKDKEQLVELYLQKCYDTNVEIEQQLKDNTKQVCEKIKIELFKKVAYMKNNNHEYIQKAVCWQDIVQIIDKIKKGGAE